MTPGGRSRTIVWEMLGRVDYEPAEALQHRLREERIAGRIPDMLLLLEHPPVLTIGRGGNAENILASAETLSALGIRTYMIGRGGDVTYHGPGQIVGYPIMDLRDKGRDVHRYLRRLEDVFIRLLAGRGIAGHRVRGATGVWVGDRKILAIGIGVRKWVTLHGFAFNVSPDLRHFQLIRPCGFEAEQVTSLADLKQRDELWQDSEWDLAGLAGEIVHAFSGAFELKPVRVCESGGDVWEIIRPYFVEEAAVD